MISDLLPQTSGKAVARRLQARLEKRDALDFSIAPEEQDDFARVPARERERVLKLLALLEDIHGRPKITEACAYHARLLARLGARRGWSAKRLRTLYYDFTGGARGFTAGDWRMFVRYEAQQADSLQTRPKFVEFWRTLVENHQRSTAAAHAELVQILATGFDFEGRRHKAIPGFDAWPDVDAATGLPKGMSLENLRRYYAPDKFELKAARVGVQAASQLGLKVSTTRVGLKFMEFVEGDDHEFNVKVRFPGQAKVMRPRCFAWAEVLTSRCCKLATKPTLWDADEQAKKALTEREFLWFTLDLLATQGYRADAVGTTLVIEHGTATVREATREVITRLTGGQVKWALSGRFHQPAHGGQFAAPSGGNFRFKAIIECYWRLVDDALDHLKGQTGKDRNFAPEEMERADAYNARLLKAATALPPDRAGQLIFNRLTWEQFTAALLDAQTRIGSATDHAIEGWEKLGFVCEEFRRALALGWQPARALLELPDAEQSLVRATVEQDDRLHRLRRLSRNEAFAMQMQAERGNLSCLPLASVPAIVGERNAVRDGEPLTVRAGRFEFDDWRIDPDGLEFLALDAQGRPLREGEKFVCFVNPMNPESLIACDAKLRVVSVCPPVPRPARNDEAGLHRALGVQRHWQAEKAAPQRARHADQADEIAFMRRHNEAVLAGRPVTAEEKASARNVRRFGGGMEDLAATEEQTVAVGGGEGAFDAGGLL